MEKKDRKGITDELDHQEKLGLDHIGVLDGFWENYLGTGKAKTVGPK